MRTDFAAVFVAMVFLLLQSGCVDSVEPAGPAQYVNPDYPSDLRGYALIPSTFSDAFIDQGRVYVLDRTFQMMVSFSASDPNLAIPESLVVKDTLLLGIPPSHAAFCPEKDVLFFAHDSNNDIYRLNDIHSGTPSLLYVSESIVTDILPVDNGNSLVICFLGPEWSARKIDSSTGEIQGEYQTNWPINEASVSPDGSRILLSNSAAEYLLEIDTETMQQTDSIPVPERIGTFLYNTSGDIIVFNQYTIHPRVYLFDKDSREIIDIVECINPYRVCSLIPGTDVVLAPRRSDNRISVLNTENMVFAPSIFCFNYAEMAFSANDGEIIVVLSDSPGRAYIYEDSDRQ